MKTLLVTGAYGFVGRHIALAAADAGYAVSGIGHGNWTRDEWKAWGLQDWRTDDVKLDALLTYAGTPDVIVHCAGSGSVGFSMIHPQQDFARTVVGTLAVLEFIRLSSPNTRLVLPSSAAVYGNCSHLPIRIDDTLAPTSPYGVHKKMAEELCQSYARHFQIDAAIVRLFSVYGNGLRKQLLWDACMKIVDRNIVFSGTGDETRDWIHVNDAASLLLEAANQANSSCPIVNGGAGSRRSIRDVITALCNAFRTDEVPSFDGRQRAGDPIHYEADIEQALKWGWKPTQNMTQQLQAYVSWFQSEAK